jgi:hypothetical protein
MHETIVSSSEPRLPLLKDDRAVAKPVLAPVATRSQLLKEYTEACANMRHYGNARLTRLVMFLALNGGLLNILFTHRDTVAHNLITAAKVAAILITILFGIVDYNLVVHFRWFCRRAMEVEGLVGLQQYTQRQANRDRFPHNVLNETHATWLMYTTVGVFWVYCLAML